MRFWCGNMSGCVYSRPLFLSFLRFNVHNICWLVRMLEGLGVGRGRGVLCIAGALDLGRAIVGYGPFPGSEQACWCGYRSTSCGSSAGPDRKAPTRRARRRGERPAGGDGRGRKRDERSGQRARTPDGQPGVGARGWHRRGLPANACRRTRTSQGIPRRVRAHC